MGDLRRGFLILAAFCRQRQASAKWALFEEICLETFAEA